MNQNGKLRLYVEDRYKDTYEVLAKKCHELQGYVSAGIQAIQLDLGKFRDIQQQIDRAHKDGFTCVVFVIDREGVKSKERPALLDQIQNAFDDFCKNRPAHLADMHVALVITERCVESSLVSDVNAIILNATRGKGMDVVVAQPNQTDHLQPDEATTKITDTLKRVKQGRGNERQRHRAPMTKYEKSSAPEIAAYMEITTEVLKRNLSLRYFTERVQCQNSGCTDSQKFRP